MAEAVDFFFSPYLTPLERRRRAALRDGLAHGSEILPRDPAPSEAVTLFFSSNATLPVERIAVYYTTDGTEPTGECGASSTSHVVLAEVDGSEFDGGLDLPLYRWSAVIPGQPDGTLVRYRADGWSMHDPRAHWYADNVDPITAAPERGRVFAYSVDTFRVPAWADDAIIYHLLVDRFSAASDEPAIHDPGAITDFFGGTLRGVLEKLDYIEALGVNCIWLSPVFESPSAHGYNPSDYYQVAGRYGTNEVLRRLIDAAHRRGIRVILDFVANHTSDEHALFVEARANPETATAAWYSFGDWSPHGYRSYAHVPTMPELVTEHPGVQRYLTAAALHWLDYFGADGLRLDYVAGPTHAFWARFQRAIKQRFPDALTIGEISEDLPGIARYAGRLDAFMDFPLAKVLRQVFAQRTAPLARLLAYLDERRSRLPAGMGRATVLDNHDMHRFLWLAGGNIARLKLAAVCQMTLEGTPIIYYGSEVGLSQSGDAQVENAYARAPMLWGCEQDQGLLAHYRRMVALRRTHAALRRGARITVPVDMIRAAPEASEQVGAYLRVLDGAFLLVVLNNAEQPVNMRICLAEGLATAGLAMPAGLLDLLTPASAEVHAVADGAVEVTVPALGAAVLKPV